LAGGRGATLTDHVVQLSAFDQLQILSLGERLGVLGEPTRYNDEAAFCSLGRHDTEQLTYYVDLDQLAAPLLALD